MVNKKQKQSETKLDDNQKLVLTIVVTSKHGECNLMFTNHGKEDGTYPLKEIARHKTKIRDLL
jgi:hypothetical protein